MPVFFPNEEIELYTYSEDDYDFHGPKNEYTLRETVKGNFSPLTTTSSLKEFGKILTDTYKLILDENTEIHDSDMVVVNNIKYEIIGTPENWNHGLLPHKEVLLQKLRNDSRGE
ncbi:hypothetical protein [Methanobrevibacter sp.]|uniref:hypothetical protein n=1 Tax=Methanobrevibacter sp. TaxID=66852 RepID=UPI0025F4DE90|nr:hypothetical protein [Methanobrevibacter sp.]MBQ2832327.1 hypothetical protein [Methanobrevibacter sp.]MBQ4163593.1 hypothetical protein [Turicibacter sp.]